MTNTTTACHAIDNTFQPETNVNKLLIIPKQIQTKA